MFIGADWVSHANQKGVTHALVVELILSGVVTSMGIRATTCMFSRMLGGVISACVILPGL